MRETELPVSWDSSYTRGQPFVPRGWTFRSAKSLQVPPSGSGDPLQAWTPAPPSTQSHPLDERFLELGHARQFDVARTPQQSIDDAVAPERREQQHPRPAKRGVPRRLHVRGLGRHQADADRKSTRLN